MKKIFTLGLFAIGALSTLQAQISITTADLPVLGGSYVMLQDSATALSAPSTGTGQTWNYTSLTNVRLCHRRLHLQDRRTQCR